MTVTMTNEKISKMRKTFHAILLKMKITIRQFAQIIGIIVAAFPGAEFGPLHYRTLEIDKAFKLKCSKGNFETLMVLSDECRSEIDWWISKKDISCIGNRT